ncbi:aldo/keto reductase [Oceanospirillum sediminis]|uniref:Aldo/keto reductase n=1 Tax=Oceanospirillum sediminis TaxID=2760088 RepID=A0A839IU91_9GAMM|nr:aldo/keto reductase [Oceanospirillum sediminis]MBB1487686.1 aldo/keto reductase [Oceanospirillum sediminis]
MTSHHSELFNHCSPIGLGCMNLSHAYGTPPPEKDAERLLLTALDLGYNHLDTASLYGFGANESLLGKTLKSRRNEFILASKCVLFKDDLGKRILDARPETIRKTLEGSLQRLQTDVIDLYYLHRLDRNVPIEDSVGELSRMVEEGKIRNIGLSEMSAKTLRRAHEVHPIAAMQTEYSLWTRNPEIAVLETCRELGTKFVAFSPLGRAFLTGKLTDLSALAEKDLRRSMPRFEQGNYTRNLVLLDQVSRIAQEEGCTLAQLALAWVLGRGDHIIAIPGTTNPEHLKENFSAKDITLSASAFDRLDQIINQTTVSGPRYNADTQLEIDTEEFS